MNDPANHGHLQTQGCRFVFEDGTLFFPRGLSLMGINPAALRPPAKCCPPTGSPPPKVRLRIHRVMVRYKFGEGCIFMNYQWGREAIGSDVGLIVRHTDADNYYQVRLSTGYGHGESCRWKVGLRGLVEYRCA